MTKSITHLFQLTLLFLSTLMGFTGCQDPTTLGTDLLDKDRVNVGFTDTIPVRAKTLLGDSVLTYSPTRANQLTSYLFGDFRDPIFGRSQASIYFQVRPEALNPDFSNSRLDSVVLVLPYDTTGLYGLLNETFGVEVHTVTENMDRAQVYFSNKTFATDPAAIGRKEFIPSLDSIRVVRYLSATSRDTIRFPHLRIPLDRSFGEALLRLDTTLLKTDSAFLSYLPGIQVRPTTATKGLLSFDLNSSPFLGGVYMYYTQDTVKREFQFAIDDFSTRFVHYDHDYTGTRIADFLAAGTGNDSLLFAQGMGGTDVEVELLDLDQYRGLLVNKAELVINLREMAGDDPSFRPVNQFLLSVRDATTGNYVIIQDVAITSQLGNLSTAFGGILNKETKTYTMNISSYLQDAIDGKEPPSLILTVFPKSQNPKRAVLYGAGDPLRGIKVRLAFTEL